MSNNVCRIMWDKMSQKKFKNMNKNIERLIKNGFSDSAERDLVNSGLELANNISDNFNDYMSYQSGQSIGSEPNGELLIETIDNHTHNEYANANWYLEKTKYNPIAQYSVKVIPTVSYNKQKHRVTVSAQGKDIRFLEYGTGTIGENNPHPKADEVGWKYNSGKCIHTDANTGIDYWVHHGVAHVGNAPGAFVYDAIEQYKKDHASMLVSGKGGKSSAGAELKKCFKG